MNALSEPLAEGPGLRARTPGRGEATTDEAWPRGATLVSQVACVQRSGSPFNQGGPGQKLSWSYCEQLRPSQLRTQGRSGTQLSAYIQRRRTSSWPPAESQFGDFGSLERQQAGFPSLAVTPAPAPPGPEGWSCSSCSAWRASTSFCFTKFSPSWYLGLQGESLPPTAMAACSGSCQYIAFWMFKHTCVCVCVCVFSFLDTIWPWCVFFSVYWWIWFAKILHQVFACNVRDGPLIFVCWYVLGEL